MDLFQALPALRQHPLLHGQKVALVGVSAIVQDAEATYFEIGKPKYWQQREDGSTAIGVGAIGGGIKPGEGIVACLQRESEEEIGAHVRLDLPQQTYLIRGAERARGASGGEGTLKDWQIAGTLTLRPHKKRPTPLMVILVPPRLGGPGTPDHLAILGFCTRLRSTPVARDLFGLLRIENGALAPFFERDEWPVEKAQAHPALTLTLNGQLPPSPVLRPILTARAFQLVVRAGHR